MPMLQPYRAKMPCMDRTATIAAEDRNLKAEADNLDGVVDALCEMNARLYPPLCFGLTTLPTCVN